MKHKIIIIGGGHAGTEAAFIAARLKIPTCIITMSANSIGRMSCNPAIGGLAKGQIVREMDMLGGSMPSITDKSGLQFKILNKTKGRSVWSPRAQVDKRRYEKRVQHASKDRYIEIIEGEVVSLLIKNYRVSGVVLRNNETISAASVIITCGTFMSGVIHIGNRKSLAGRMGEGASYGLTEFLQSCGFTSGRLKTGTPPRLNKNSINWKHTTEALGDKNPVPFSYSTKNFSPPNIPCHTINTNKQTHKIIKQNLNKSPMYSGDINGVGPRYCPSIEDKVHRFSHHGSHNLFLEPEWETSDQIYLNGFSTSLPEDIQLQALRSIPALSSVDLLRPGYAIEYDFFHPAQLKSSLETKEISGLFFAGQINGTSGYEEAGAQGLLAGINSVSYVNNKPPLVLGRSDAYIGVMVDDLITKDTFEPYRMFTSRAEYRLMLRFSNTEERLFKKSLHWGLLSEAKTKNIELALRARADLRKALSVSVSPDEIESENIKPKQKLPARDFLKRTGVSFLSLPSHFQNSAFKKRPLEKWIKEEIMFDVESEIKYGGYIKRHLKEISLIKAQEKKEIPPDADYSSMVGLSLEAKEKLSFVRPENIGQAARISGVNASDVSVVMINIHK